MAIPPAQRGLFGGLIVGAILRGRGRAIAPRRIAAARGTTRDVRDARELLGFATVAILAVIVSGHAIRLTHELKRAWSAVMPSMLIRIAAAGS